MSIPRPHFLLFSDASRSRPSQRSSQRGAWRFVLEELDGATRLEAEDAEDEPSRDRLELLAVVRGLEALDQPSRVTLVTTSRYVARGLRYGLREWRESEWQWERFGQMAPVRNGDLWQRIDRALTYHQVECRTVGARSEERWEAEPLGAPDSPRASGGRGQGEAAPVARHPGRGSWWRRSLAAGRRMLSVSRPQPAQIDAAAAAAAPTAQRAIPLCG